jgi:hypothetical protein
MQDSRYLQVDAKPGELQDSARDAIWLIDKHAKNDIETQRFPEERPPGP